METTNTNPALHPFEAAGLGKAPYRLLRVEVKVHTAGGTMAGRVEQPAGTCDFCLNGIKNVYVLKAACGARFGVGCDCVERISERTSGDAALAYQVKAAKAKAAKAARLANAKRDAQTVADMLADEATRARIANHPHPTAFMARSGHTLADWAEWMLDNAGASGVTKVRRALAKVA